MVAFVMPERNERTHMLKKKDAPAKPEGLMRTIESIPERFQAIQWDGTEERADMIAAELNARTPEGAEKITAHIHGGKMPTLNTFGLPLVDHKLFVNDWLLFALSDAPTLIVYTASQWAMVQNYREVEAE